MPAKRTFTVPEKEVSLSYKEITIGQFKDERELHDLIYENINEVMRTVFGETVSSSFYEYRFTSGGRKLGAANIALLRARVDIVVDCTSGSRYLIEVKNPRKSEKATIAAMSQLMLYDILDGQQAKLVVFSSQYDDGWNEVREKYKLPIDFVLVTNDQMFLLE